MYKMRFNYPVSPNILDRAATDVIKAVTAEETALSNILDLENAIIEKAKKVAVNLEEFVAINESVNGIIGNITKLQAKTQIKLELLQDLLYKVSSFIEDSELEE